MSTLATIALCIGLIPVAVIFLTVISNPQTVRDSISRFFLIPLCVPEMLRNGCAYLINHVRGFLRGSINSVGFSGEHSIQRIIGAILLTFCTTVAIIVSILILMVTLEGAFNSGNDSLINILPISIEALIAIELVAAGVLFGMLLLDVLGVTHLTKFYCPENLPRYLRYILGAIFVIGVLFSIYLLAAGGYIRYASLISEATETQVDSTYQPDYNLYLPEQTFNDVQIEEEKLIITQTNSNGTSAAFNISIKSLMVGIPISSGLSGLFGAIGLIPFWSMLIAGLSFIVVALIFGPPWLVSHALVVLINHIYNFVSNLLNIFIDVGDGLRRRFRGQPADNPQNNTTEPPPSEPSNTVERTPENSNTTQTNNNNPQSEEANQAEQTENPMYEKDDPNWNPLV
ncbi:MAG: hypothetical protein AB1480_09665 [Nitrospirota bacterium]